MKPILGVAVLLSWFSRCHDVDFPHGHHPGHGHHADAGAEQEPDAGNDAAIEMDAALPPVDAGQPPEPCDGPPGLYVEDSCEQLAEGVRPYKPRYELYSDDATKARFIYLPPGTQIDVANADRWSFPVKTRLYKTFSVGKQRVETRVFEKIKPEPGIDSWTFVAYLWSEDQLSVSLADVAGVADAAGTKHDIPSQAQCKTCHTMTTSVMTTITDAMTGAVTMMPVTKNLDAVNGFTAIQLNHPDAGLTLTELQAQGRLFNSTGGPSVDIEASHIPGDEKAQAALGYLHTNCAHCHGGASPRAQLNLTAKVGMTLENAPAVKTGVCVCLTRWTGRTNPEGELYSRRIQPGHPTVSGIIGRMSVRVAGEQMPQFGTEQIDSDGLAVVSDWISSLDRTTCDAAPACPPPAPAVAPAPVSPPAAGAAAPSISPAPAAPQ